MNLIGNIIWLIFGGLFTSIAYFLLGLIYCITIIGIPFGLQLFKIAIFTLAPFGSTSSERKDNNGVISLFFNIIWIIFGGLELAIFHLIAGAILCVTIIGIPFGLQHFKLLPLALLPFGREIVEDK